MFSGTAGTDFGRDFAETGGGVQLRACPFPRTWCQSGTEPLIRVMVEAETPEICEKYVDQVIDVLKKKGHVTEG